MSASPAIRPGTPADAAAIADLIRRENHRPADAAAIATSLGSAPSTVAERDGELVAFFYGRPFAPDVVEMQNMLIAEAERGHGLGRKMVEITEEALRAAGYRAAVGANSVLHRGATAERCAAARAFWLHMGWRIALATGGGTVVLVRWLGTPRPRRGVEGEASGGGGASRPRSA